MNPNWTYSDEDKINPIYCTQCRVHVPRNLANSDGFCPDCLQKSLAVQDALMQRQIALQQQRQTMQQAQAQASGTCSHCGTICPTSAKFCPQCGQSINPNAPIYLLIQHPNRAIQHQNRAIWAGFTTLMTLMLALYGGSLWIWSDKHFEPKIQQAQMELAAFDREVQTTGMLTGVSYSETKRKWNDTYQKGAKSIQKIENEANFYKVLAVCLIAPLVINLIYWFIIFAF